MKITLFKNLNKRLNRVKNELQKSESTRKDYYTSYYIHLRVIVYFWFDFFWTFD